MKFSGLNASPHVLGEPRNSSKFRARKMHIFRAASSTENSYFCRVVIQPFSRHIPQASGIAARPPTT